VDGIPEMLFNQSDFHSGINLGLRTHIADPSPWSLAVLAHFVPFNEVIQEC
jgi:hypothetical protein